ncbi:hypothetical protein [Flavobacterium sp. LB2P6]|uniref:hypothetical protein n=1 Tax=Flavobacterium sp. LB2P6 TaxID=3401714 RepID=UPI003AAED4FE
MSKSYDQLIQKINQRSNPDFYTMKALFAEENGTSLLFENKKLKTAEVYIYVQKAMKGVAQEYTNNSKTAANQVEAHLKLSHGGEVHFERQGSVMTNTHIIKDNDIDLVQITNKSKGVDHSGLKKALDNPIVFNSIELKNLKKHSDDFSQYEGNQLTDLKAIRKKSEEVLASTYKEVDVKKVNSIYVQVSSPKRDVDVVTATYYKGVEYMKTNRDYRRGIQIYNKDLHKLLDVDYPFWSIKRINERSVLTNGRLKNMIRFIKNVKFDCDNIDNKGAIRSFHVNAICYNINITKYQYAHFLDLVSVINEELIRISIDKSYRDNIKSVDGTEIIFEKDCDKKLQEIRFLQAEINQIITDLNLLNKQLR